jgi:NAD(P)-dependent dehydrogenase (short-subunit alcohol dehydrogenase family)
VAKAVDEFGSIDILVNNAGSILRAPLLELPVKDWDQLMGVDLRGYFLCCQAVGKRMVEQKRGNIINISTQFAFKTDAGFGAYSIAKAGVVMLTRALAKELGPYGIRANSIAPGLIRTEFSRQSWTNPAFLKQYEVSIPSGRIGEIRDIVGAALFLASEASSYMTGHTIVIDGGALA